MKDSSRTIPTDKVKDVLITRTAIKLLKPEQIVEKIVNFQYKDAVAHTKIENAIEISGFGKFYASPVKVARKIKNFSGALEKIDLELVSPSLPEERRRLLVRKKEDLENAIVYLKSKQE